MKRPLLISGIVAGALLTLSPLVGTVFGMHRALDTLSSSGINDPERLSSNIGLVLSLTVAGIVAVPIGLLVVAACTVLLIRDYRKTPPPPPLPSAGLPNDHVPPSSA